MVIFNPSIYSTFLTISTFRAQDAGFKFLNRGFHVRVDLYFFRSLWLACFRHPLRERFDLTDRETLGYDLFCNFALQFSRIPRRHRLGVTLGEPAGGEKVLNIRRQLEESKEVRNGASILSRSLPNLLMTEVEVLR